MAYSELSVKNFKRICLINWSLTLPMMLLFAWPFFLFARWTSVHEYIAYTGAFFFALPFMITVLHGHVTMALGALHRHHYYKWLTLYPFTWGFMFRSMMFRTRFRLTLLFFASLILFSGWAITYLR